MEIPKKHPKDMTTKQQLVWEANLTEKEKADWIAKYPEENPNGKERFDELLKHAAKPKK